MSYWDQFEDYKEETPTSQVTTQTPPSDYWSQFEDYKPEPTLGEETLRIGAGGLASAFTSSVGLPGDLEALIRPYIAEHQKGEGGLVGKISKERVLPTSQELKERAQELHPELKPRGKKEEIFQEISGLTPLAPGGLLRKLGISTASVFGKEAAKELGASEGVQAGTQILTGVLASRFGQPNVKDFIDKAYAKASRSIPAKATIPSKPSELYLKSIENKISKGATPKWKENVKEQIHALEKNFKNGQVEVQALDQSVKDMNKIISGLNSKKDAEEIKYLTKIKKGAQHELMKYGKQNPEFWNEYKKANASFAGFKQSKKASDWLNKNKYKVGLGTGPALLAELVIGGAELTAKTAAALTTAYGIGKSGELIARIFSNPILASYYMKALASAANENSKQFVHNISKLDKELKKSNA